MPPKLAFFLGIVFVGFMYRVVERRRAADVSPALLWPLLWYIIASSRSIGLWLIVLGVPLPSGGGETEGSVVDRTEYFILCLIGIYILSKRNIEWSSIFRENRWLVVLFTFMLLSVAWSDYPWVSFKRLVKSFSAVVMVLVVLTETDPSTAISTIMRRGAYLVIPLSIIVIKYFRDVGVEFDSSGTSMAWRGLSTSKNALGQVAMASALCFVWSIVQNWRKKRPWASLDYLYLAMSLYLLKGSDQSVSMTALSVFALGLAIFLSSSHLRNTPGMAFRVLTVSCVSILGVLALLVVHTVSPFREDSVLGVVFRALGRDTTLSGRTEIWADVLQVASRNPLFGVGYGAFWIGRTVNIPWNEQMSWVLGEGHNGYLDVYLQIGLIGLLMLLALVFSARRRLIQSLAADFEYGRFRLTFLVVILFVNLTESTFLRGEHLLWFLFLLSVVTVPYMRARNAEVASIDTAATAAPEEGT
ncbi:MAG: O-antigen ligase family protein [Opitutaceae bacterium]|jgi:O-antigen ligase